MPTYSSHISMSEHSYIHVHTHEHIHTHQTDSIMYSITTVYLRGLEKQEKNYLIRSEINKMEMKKII